MRKPAKTRLRYNLWTFSLDFLFRLSLLDFVFGLSLWTLFLLSFATSVFPPKCRTRLSYYILCARPAVCTSSVLNMNLTFRSSPIFVCAQYHPVLKYTIFYILCSIACEILLSPSCRIRFSLYTGASFLFLLLFSKQIKLI